MTAPIGLFDSGLGGLSVARVLLEQRPSESLWMAGDTAHVPYGGRPLHEVHGFAMGLADYLVRGGCRAVVMACNISSAVALNDARQRFPVPIFGTVDAGARAAVAAAPNGRYGVMATAGTVKTNAFAHALEALRPGVDVVEVPCPDFVPLVESGQWDSDAAYEAARRYAAPCRAAGVDTLILGCTHYPFLAPAIRAAFPDGIRLIDPAEAVVAELARALPSTQSARPAHRYEATADPAAFAQRGSLLLGVPFHAQHCPVWDTQPPPLLRVGN